MNGFHQRSPVALLLVAALAAGSLCGCKQEGPAETAGKKIDQAVERTGDTLTKAGEEVGKAVEQTGDALEKAGDKIEDKMTGEKK